MPLYTVVAVTVLALTATGTASFLSRDDSYDGSENDVVTTTDEPPSASCPGCAAAKRKQEELSTPWELRQLKIEIIKQQILSKLRLKAPPKLRIPKSELPNILAHGEVLALLGETDRTQERIPSERAQEDDYYGTTKNIVVFPENATANVSCPCYTANPSNCLSFRLSRNRIIESIASTELWLFKTNKQPNNKTLVISEVVHGRSCGVLRKRILAIERDPPGSGWLRFNLGTTVSRWVTKPHLTHYLEIACKGCSGGAVPISFEERHRPFLVITTAPPIINNRIRRDAQCTNTSTRCCKESFYLSFEDIGWDTWIIEPKGYVANYCRGTCVSDVSATRYHHTTVLQRYIQRKIGRDEVSDLSLCCSASRMSALSMIYIHEDGHSIFEKTLPNMVVEACDCT